MLRMPVSRYVRDNKNHIGLKYNTRKDKGKIRRKTCRCGAPRHCSKLGKLYGYCLVCKDHVERSWAQRNPDRWAAHQQKSRLKCKFGLTVEQFEKMLLSQNSLCAICARKMIVGGPNATNKAHIDHNHETSRVRSLLCTQCNWMLGQARESEDILRAAIGYLRKWATNE